MLVHVERRLLINYKLHASIRVGSLAERMQHERLHIFYSWRKVPRGIWDSGNKDKDGDPSRKKNMEGIIAAHMRNVNMTTGNKEFEKFRFFLAAYFLKCTEGDLESWKQRLALSRLIIWISTDFTWFGNARTEPRRSRLKGRRMD